MTAATGVQRAKWDRYLKGQEPLLSIADYSDTSSECLVRCGPSPIGSPRPNVGEGLGEGDSEG